MDERLGSFKVWAIASSATTNNLIYDFGAPWRPGNTVIGPQVCMCSALIDTATFLS